MNNPYGQDIPSEIPTRVKGMVKVLDENRKGIARWFWKGLFAFNLILGSLAFWALLLLRFG